MTDRPEVASRDVKLKALELLELAMTAESAQAAVGPLRLDLEVLPRDELVRVAIALAVEATWILPHKVDRPRLAERLGRHRLMLMVGES